MVDPSQDPPEDTARVRMVAMIAALRRSRPAEDHASTQLALARTEDARLAAVAWRAVHVAPPREPGEWHEDGGPTPLESGAKVGRYVVLRPLGAGGMGVVYAAYDPELDRKVALKLVAPGFGGEDGSVRLLREAQALAKLSHPNVVTIHDVGTMRERVWLAMELVRGQTLREWLRARRTWRDVLEVMRQAGTGLAAAHEAGLLHRDFKPENVMITRSGDAKVMDFGLARARAREQAIDAEESIQAPLPAMDTLAKHITLAGTMVGTPHYMAPEQLLGSELTPAVDQLALCVTLWEALYGERPFAGETLDEVIAAMLDGRVREPARRRAVPAWLRRVCERGLSTRPQERFESMAALLDALAKGRARARMRMGLGAVGAIALVGAGMEAHRRIEVANLVADCEASGAAVEAAWNPSRRQALHDALLGTGVSYAPATVEKVTPWLDRQAREWQEARVETCLDARVRERWGASMHDRSVWCLDEARIQLETLVDELIQADADVLQKAVKAAAGLAPVVSCRDEGELADLELPPPEADDEAMRAVRSDMLRVASLERVGRYQQGLELVRATLERAEVLERRSLKAAVKSQLGSMLMRTGAHREAAVVLEDAYFEATQALAPALAYEAAVKLVGISERLARYDEGLRWGRHAEAALVRVADREGLRRVGLYESLAAIHEATGDYDEAKRRYAQALAVAEEALGPHHPRVAGVRSNLANAHYSTGDYERAIDLHTRASSVLEEALGPTHPLVGLSLSGLANAYVTTGAYDRAKVLNQRAAAILEEALGPEHSDLAMVLGNLAQVLTAMGDYEQALVLNRRVLAILEGKLGPNHPSVGLSLNDMAAIHLACGANDEATAALRRALAILEKALGAEHPHVAMVVDGLAGALTAGGAHEEARVHHERALATFERTLSATDPRVAHSLVGLARIALAQHRPLDAVSLAERALALREQGNVPAAHLAEARFVLAQALWDAPIAEGRDRSRAQALATQARDALRDAGKGSAKELAAVEQWLAEHPAQERDTLPRP